MTRKKTTQMTPLRQRMIDAMLLRGFRPRTQECYRLCKSAEFWRSQMKGAVGKTMGPSEPVVRWSKGAGESERRIALLDTVGIRRDVCALLFAQEFM